MKASFYFLSCMAPFILSFDVGYAVSLYKPTSISLTDEQKDLMHAFELSASATVYKVFIKDEKNVLLGSGSGFVVKYKERLYFITNSHVCMPSPMQDVVQVGGESKFVAGRKRSNKADLCAARINHLASVPYLILSPTKLKPNELVYSAGYPDGEYGGTVLKFKEVQIQQWVTGFLKDQPNPEDCSKDFSLIGTPLKDMCLTNTPMAFAEGRVIPGASGSPVFNAEGDIVGVVAGTVGPYSVFVPVSELIKFLDEAF